MFLGLLVSPLFGMISVKAPVKGSGVYNAKCTQLVSTIPDNPYECVDRKVIGEGGFGAVYEVKYQKGHLSYALKVQKTRGNFGPCETEVALLKALFVKKKVHILDQEGAEIIPKLIDSHKVENNCFISMELFDGGDMNAYVKQNQNKFGPSNTGYVLKKFLEMCQAIQFIHSNDYIHRDIKLGNMVLDSNSRTQAIKIIDFGLVVGKGKGHSYAGTPGYVAPEFAADPSKSKPWLESADIYSLGICLYRMSQKNRMYDYAEISEADPAAVSTEYHITEGTDAEIVSLINEMTQLVPENRPTLPKVIERIQEFKASKFRVETKVGPLKLTNNVLWKKPSDVKILKKSLGMSSSKVSLQPVN